MRGKMTQKDMATATGKAQTWISKLEDPNYGRYTLTTLLELAHFHDVGLEVDFVPFSKLLDEVVNPNVRRVPSFSEELPEQPQDDITDGVNLFWGGDNKGNEESAEQGSNRKPSQSVPAPSVNFGNERQL
jgi:transcriptional regulator with XRE-family HTH domain